MRRTNIAVLVAPAADVPGLWLAHALDWDLFGTGESIEQALESVQQAIVSAAVWDLDEGRDPGDRPAAPPECWTQIADIRRNGVPLCDVSDRSLIKALLTEYQVETPLPSSLPELPPAWQIASLAKLASRASSAP
ncbi:hypothetical protein ACFL5O_00035 [Myxococcota bacterium]